jgi:hypothetical protein
MGSSVEGRDNSFVNEMRSSKHQYNTSSAIREENQPALQEEAQAEIDRLTKQNDDLKTQVEALNQM